MNITKRPSVLKGMKWHLCRTSLGHTMLRLVEQLVNAGLPSQQEVSQGLARWAVLQEHGGHQGLCNGLVWYCTPPQQRLTVEQDSWPVCSVPEGIEGNLCLRSLLKVELDRQNIPLPFLAYYLLHNKNMHKHYNNYHLQSLLIHNINYGSTTSLYQGTWSMCALFTSLVYYPCYHQCLLFWDPPICPASFWMTSHGTNKQQ